MNTMPFKAAWWFRNPHFQTIWPALFRYIPQPDYQRQRIELRDGDFIDIDWCGNNLYDRPVVILLHGLEGSSGSQYIRGLAVLLSKLGWRAAAINFRGCSGEANRLARSYHSGATADLDEIVDFISQHQPETPLHAVGFSLGGNLLLKWCAEKGNSCPLHSAVAVSVPYDLSIASQTLDGKTGIASIYRMRLLQSLKNKALQKVRQGLIELDEPVIDDICSLAEFDQRLTAPLHGYESADDYYSRASCSPHLGKLTIPTLLIHATDDPFMDSHGIPHETNLSDSTQLELSPHGGHVGFFKPSFSDSSYWLEKRITKYLESNMKHKK